MLANDFKKKIRVYLENVLNTAVDIIYIGPINKKDYTDDHLKEFGYGKNLLIEAKVKGEKSDFILSTVNKDIFGHQFYYDRAKSLLFAHSAYNNLLKHGKSIDVGFFTELNEFKSAGDAKEFFLLREKVEGTLYYQDLERIKKERKSTDLDTERVKALAIYLAKIHSIKKKSESLYTRRIRELIGHGECIMGLIDSYSDDLDFTDYDELKEIEKKCIDWRYKIKDKNNRLCQVHGDFHPWNILFREKIDFSVIDRSRGEWGEAADDLACMTINYLFFALQEDKGVEDYFFDLFKLFWNTYLEKSQDYKIVSIIAPFYAWRGLVLASPIWYPDLESNTRRMIFNFIRNVLSDDKFIFEHASDMLM